MKIENLTAYELIESHFVEELDSQAYILRHKKTGARFFLLENGDENKVFDIAFRTIPTDSTGVAHILEHTVLCGSEKFPAKSPIVELMKGSMNTFLNAMTYPDKTMYPCASTNDKDFQNLMAVYVDAVFHPNIYKTEYIFRQEGWHYELDSLDGELTYNGVVYNEMKGVFSSGERLLDNLVYGLLFPHTTYANVSGGNPFDIPNLTYEQYLNFHRKYYHPSNSYIYLYGNMDMEERLLWLDKEYFSHYDYLDVDSGIQMEPAFEKPVYGEIEYGITEEESDKKATYFTWNRVTGSCLDVKHCMAMEVLGYVLLGMPGAPLKQALQDAKIGSDIYGGSRNGIRQMMFTVNVRGSEYEKKEQFEAVITETLKQLVKEGLNKKYLLAGINAMEFQNREADYGSYPKGLVYAMQAFGTWLYDDKAALSLLEYNSIFSYLKEQVNTDYYERLIQEYLLNNTHGMTGVARPKKGLTARQEAQVAQKLADYKDSLSQEELQELVLQTKELRNYQKTPSCQEDLEKIPMISVQDIQKEAKLLGNQLTQWGEVPVLKHPMFTSGISYLNLVFQGQKLDLEELPYINLLTNILTYVDTKQYSYPELSSEINIHTGGIYFTANWYQRENANTLPIVTSEIQIKALHEEIPYALELTKEILFHSILDDEKRLKEIIGEVYSRMKYYLQNAGNSAAILRAASYYFAASYVGEKMSGISYFDFLTKLMEQMKEDSAAVIIKLKEVMDKLYRKENVLISYTAPEKQINACRNAILNFVDSLPREVMPDAKWNIVLEKKNEGFKTSSQVNYVARGGDIQLAGYSYTGTMLVLKSVLNFDYLWQNLRVRGGAYGCMSNFGTFGSCYFCSYRDPNVAATNEVYEHIPEYLEQFQPSKRDMTKYIIGTVSSLDKPKSPSARGNWELSCYLSNCSNEMIQKERDEVLSTTVEDIQKLAAVVRAILKQQVICAIGNQEAIERDRDIFQEVKSLF